MTRLLRKIFMNVLLQNKETMEYVKGDDEWTVLRTSARVFITGMEALFFCYNHGMKNMQIVGQCDGEMTFTVPVTDRRNH